MADPITAAVMGVVLPVLGTVWHCYTKYGYKKTKRMVYKRVKTSLENLDYEDIQESFELLKSFDEQRFDKISKTVKKKLGERLFRRTRVLKQDKMEKLFNISKEVISNPDKLKEFIKQGVLSKQLSASNEEIEKELTVIVEEEEKETETLVALGLEMEKIKVIMLSKVALQRKVIDEMNLTEEIEKIHLTYQEMIKSKITMDVDLQKNMVKQNRKEALLKRRAKLTRLSEANTGTV